MLLLSHTELGLINSSVQLIVLFQREITCLAILKDLLRLSFLYQAVFIITKTKHLLLDFLLLDHLTN